MGWCRQEQETELRRGAEVCLEADQFGHHSEAVGSWEQLFKCHSGRK